MKNQKVFTVIASMMLLEGILFAQDATSNKDPYNQMISFIKASSELVEEGNKIYPAVNLIDGTDRSWAPSESDENPTIEIIIDSDSYGPGDGIDCLYIKNGFGLDKYFSLNNRVKDIKIELFDYSDKNKPCLVMTAQLSDTKEMQAVKLPYQSRPDRIKIYILSAYKGSKYNDTCISEISLAPIDVKPYSYRPKVSDSSFSDEYFDIKLCSDFHFECNRPRDFSEFFAPGSMLGVSFIKGEWGYTSGGYIFINGYYHFGWTDPEGNAGTDEYEWRTIIFSPNWHNTQFDESNY